ncbi:Crp/Fnr family transcriptional regulator [Mucilaginibacter gotjawali]|uniref:Anaerobic regulatory protein n=2 Tax=Mucilaginibacter gotjawali TaxID=1550579 RepID=A0A0X8X4X7_9SPHI|nr:Crp/Fnr family transcriptional regulator [Mucilaginibacter gotjawali]MBB3058492.1 CRP-like cAMP-binding protein [Mucilaginibacter gotjawali]BAU55716.1 Anaerobic regulatory protein [Mucilaginibacter gotjawali]
MKKSKSECDVNSCFMCRNCLKQWQPAIAANKVNLKVKRGEVIFNEGDEVKGVYFVYDGVVKVHKKWGPDKELIIRFASKGAIFGHRGLGGNNVYPISATALEDGIVCYVDTEFFESTLKVNTEFTYNLMMFLVSELQESEKKMRNLAHMSVKGRVAQALVSLRDQFGKKEDGSINIELSRQDLASYAGATYETVFRVLNEMLKENLIKTSGKKIIINNREQLLQLTAQES